MRVLRGGIWSSSRRGIGQVDKPLDLTLVIRGRHWARSRGSTESRNAPVFRIRIERCGLI
jgi:hypothetical protein